MKIKMTVLAYLAGLASRSSVSAYGAFTRTNSPIRSSMAKISSLPNSLILPKHLHQTNIRCKSTLSMSAISGTESTSFDDGKSPFFITTPIYYVNDVPHIGHAYTSTACDVIARYMRLSGRDVMFLSGTDEHGQKVEASAAKKGVDPQDFVDDVSVNFRDLLSLMDISNDYFVRTTDTDHKEAVQVSIV